MYARGMCTRDIQAHMGDLYGIGVSPALRNITAKRKKPPREWHVAKCQFAIRFGERSQLAAETMTIGSHTKSLNVPIAEGITP